MDLVELTKDVKKLMKSVNAPIKDFRIISANHCEQKPHVELLTSKRGVNALAKKYPWARESGQIVSSLFTLTDDGLNLYKFTDLIVNFNTGLPEYNLLAYAFVDKAKDDKGKIIYRSPESCL